MKKTSVTLVSLSLLFLSGCITTPVISTAAGVAGFALSHTTEIIDLYTTIKKTDTIEEKAQLLATSYCSLRKEEPVVAEKLQNWSNKALPEKAVKRASELIEEKCGDLLVENKDE